MSMGKDISSLQIFVTCREHRCYLKFTHKVKDSRMKFMRLLCAFKYGHTGDMSKQIVSGWIGASLLGVLDEDIPHLTHSNVQVRELRAY